MIVEDEPMIAQDLAMIVEDAGFGVLGPCDTATKALEIMSSELPQLALLDINIRGEQDGVALAAKIKDFVPIIFVTSYYDSTTLRRVEHQQPQAFILKPFREEEVVMNIRLALKKSSAQARSEEEKMLVRVGDLNVPVVTSDILYAQGEDNYTRIFLRSEEVYLISQTLKTVQEKLPKHQFVRIHKSYLINKTLIDGINSKKVFIQGKPLPLGRAYKQDFLKQIALS